jgi:hypothetical protein
VVSLKACRGVVGIGAMSYQMTEIASAVYQSDACCRYRRWVDNELGIGIFLKSKLNMSTLPKVLRRSANLDGLPSFERRSRYDGVFV